MRRMAILAGALILMLAGSGSGNRAAAQTSTAPAPQAASEATTLLRSYKLDFMLTEMDDGKKINSREYSLNLGSEGSFGQPRSNGRIRIGTRVPGFTKADGSVEYLDIGTNIAGGLTTKDGALFLTVNCDVTSVATDQARVDGRPVLTNLTISNEGPVVEGKPMLVGTADDPGSKRSFRLDVTATELK